jgi:hypothetical protein
VDRRFVRLTLATLVFMAAAGAACGGGGSGSGGDPSIQTAPAGDQGVAERANLVVTDFPPEWKSTPLPTDAAAVNAANDRDFADCMGRPRPEEVRSATADSPDFSATDTRRVSSSVQLVKTDEIARGDFVALKSDRGSSCLKQQIDREFARQLPASGPATATTIEPLDLPQFGDETAAYRLTATGVVEAQQVITILDLTFVRKGRAELSAAFLNRSAPFPQELQRSLLQRMVGRA